MIKSKKLLILVIVMIFTTSICAFAEERECTVDTTNSCMSLEFTDEELTQYADLFEFEMATEDGYNLEKIIVSYDRCSDDTLINQSIDKASGDYISDVEKVSSDVYFPNNPLSSNWFDGPLDSIEKTYSKKFTGKATCSINVPISVVEAGLSFSISTEISETTTVTLPAIASDQKINIKEFGVFAKYRFYVYNHNDSMIGTGYAYKPMGLYIAQAIYTKK